MRKPSFGTRLFIFSFFVSASLLTGAYFYVKNFDEKRALSQASRAFVNAQSLYERLLESRGRTPGDVIEALGTAGSSSIYWASVAELSATGMHWILLSGNQTRGGDIPSNQEDISRLLGNQGPELVSFTLSTGRYLGRVWQTHEGQRLMLFYSLAEIERSSRELLEAFLFAGLLLLGLGAVFARILSTEISRPLLLLQENMRSLAERVGLELPARKGDEFQTMGETYLQIVRELDTAFEHKKLALEELEAYRAELLRVNGNLQRRLFQVKVMLSLWSERDQSLDVRDFLSRFLAAILPGMPYEFGCVIIRPIAPFSSEMISARKVENRKTLDPVLDGDPEVGTTWTDIIDPELKTFLLKESDACLKSADVQMNKIMGSIKSGTPPVEISLLSFRLKQGEEPLGSVHFLTEQANPVVPRTLTDFLLNISAQISAQLQIQSLSSGLRLDPLTRLYNRGYLKDRLREELVRSTRTRAALSLLLLDIDHFKSLNEKYGRQTGDEVLRSLAGLIKKMSRGSDTICRYSGTVFAIALADTSSAGAKAFADNVLKAVEAEAFKAINGETLQITVSIGIAEFPIDAEGVDELISKSETALSEAKIEGRNRWKAA